MYSEIGRPSIAREKLLRALLLQILYTIRSERMLMEQPDYNLLSRWFVGLNMNDAVWWDAKVCCRLLVGREANILCGSTIGGRISNPELKAQRSAKSSPHQQWHKERDNECLQKPHQDASIVSHVTAVYTATDPRSGSISIDVQSINERQV
jgi:hypothetical protein